MKSLFVSAHYDDAVYSCGKLIGILEDVDVVTVFGGVPDTKNVVTAYDQKSGFENAEDAILQRRTEDAVALTTLGAGQIWLDYPENQYDQEVDISHIRKDLLELMEDYDEVYFPLGMQHPDHETLGGLCRGIEKRGKKIYIYIDMPYYVDNPELFVDRLKSIKNKSYVYRGGDIGKKMIAVACYKSQFKIMNIYHLMADERYYT